MNLATEWCLTFLTNAAWQAVVILLIAIACDRTLAASSPRGRHAMWVATLALLFVVPSGTVLFLRWTDLTSALRVTEALPLTRPAIDVADSTIGSGAVVTSSFSVSTITAFTVVGLYLIFVLYRTARLIMAWRRTRRLFESSETLNLGPAIAEILAKCCERLNVERIPVLFSQTVFSPVTIGTRRPVVILPEAMKDETDHDLLLSAIGHEVVHVTRRDYLLNLVCEIVFLPLSFHPATSYVKRRIDHTRELCCDELVTRQLIKAENYARSLIKLASSAAAIREPAMTTVGMGDADNLEVRIMSLLDRSKTAFRGRSAFVIGGLVALAAAGVVIGGFGFRVGVTEVNAQKTEKQEPCTEVGPDCFAVTVNKNEVFMREWRAKIAAEHPEFTPDQVNAVIEKKVAELKAGPGLYKIKEDSGPADQAKLAQEAQIPMEQAIQTAVAIHPGVVIESVLVRERGLPMYRIVVLDKDSADGAVTFFLVNAHDGQIVKNENRKIRVKSPE